jgi:tetratricopeptide (TPR) repeat protein
MAVSYYTAAIAANPHDKATLTNRANALARLKKFKESLNDYRAALEVDPNDGSIYYNRALTYYYMGELEKCLADLEDSKKRNFPVDESIIRAIRSEWRSKKQND